MFGEIDNKSRTADKSEISETYYEYQLFAVAHDSAYIFHVSYYILLIQLIAHKLV